MFTAKWEGEPLIIHNAGQRNREDNRLASLGGISGHYRFDASRLDMAGVDVMTAKEQLGHSDIKTTLNIYTHLDKEHKVKSIDKLDAYLSKFD